MRRSASSPLARSLPLEGSTWAWTRRPSAPMHCSSNSDVNFNRNNQAYEFERPHPAPRISADPQPVTATATNLLQMIIRQGQNWTTFPNNANAYYTEIGAMDLGGGLQLALTKPRVGPAFISLLKTRTLAGMLISFNRWRMG